MAGVRRRLFSVISLVSLLLCAAGSVLWADSMRHLDGLGCKVGTSRLAFIGVDSGTLWLGSEKTKSPWLIAVRKDHIGMPGIVLGGTVLGFGILNNSLDRGIGFPLWLALPLLCIIAGVFWMKSRRCLEKGFCKCGYNLTGNVSGVCPECGTSIQSNNVPAKNLEIPN